MTKAESNQQNAELSTGPKTPEGKAIVSKNALKHGAYSQAIIIIGEDPAAFEALQAGMMESLNPIGLLEERLVDRLSALFWRIERAGRAENDAMRLSHSYTKPESLREYAPAYAALSQECFADAMSRISRYEGQLERSFFRVLHELERIQARRKGETVIPPAVADVSVHGVGSGD